MKALLSAAWRCLVSLSKFGRKNLDKREFNALRTPALRAEFLESRGFQPVGYGSGRHTYIINPKKALKLAINDKGVAQNIAEYNILISVQSPFLPKFYDKAPDNSWMEVELVVPLTSDEEVERYFGVPIEVFQEVLTQPESIVNEFKRKIDFHNLAGRTQEAQDLENVLSNQKLMSFVNLVKELGIASGPEIYGLKNLGRNSSGDIVILDAGLTGEVYGEFYSPYRDKEIETYAPTEEYHPFVYDTNPQFDSVAPVAWDSKDPKNVLPPNNKEQISQEITKILDSGNVNQIENLRLQLLQYYYNGDIDYSEYNGYGRMIDRLTKELRAQPAPVDDEFDDSPF